MKIAPALIALASTASVIEARVGNTDPEVAPPTAPEQLPEAGGGEGCAVLTKKGPKVDNPCEGKDPGAPNVPCVVGEIGEQAGADVTEGYKGEAAAQGDPILTPYWKAGMCPVNVSNSPSYYDITILQRESRWKLCIKINRQYFPLPVLTQYLPFLA